MAEIEFSVLSRACLRGRNADQDNLERAVRACVSERNAGGPLLTGGSLPKTPDATSTAFIPANPDLVQY